MSDTSFKMKGFNFTGWGKTAFADRALVRKGLDYIVATGSNFIAIDWGVNFEENGTIASKQVSPPPLSDISYVVEQAKLRNLGVYLKPHSTKSDNSSNLNHWNTDPKIFSAKVFLNDWKSYMVTLAEFAQAKGVDGIFIGTEASMADTVERVGWSQLISAVRGKFSGSITYDALISGFKDQKDVGDVVFLDLLDFISVSLYVPLSKNDSATLQELNQSWTNNPFGDIFDMIGYLKSVSETYGKQILFGETGYQSVKGALYDTNSYPSDQKTVDNQVQVRGLESIFDTWSKFQGDWLKGMSIWQVSPALLSDLGLTSIYHTQEFSSFGKPSAELITKWYSGQIQYSDPNFLGSSGADTLVGSYGKDIILGGPGNDILKGNDGDDTINGNGLHLQESMRLRLEFRADVLDNIGPKFDLFVNDKILISDREIRATRSGLETQAVAVDLSKITDVKSVKILFKNEEYRGPGLDRNLYLVKASFDGVAISKSGSLYHPLFDPVSESWVMGQGGFLLLSAPLINNILSTSLTDSDVIDGGSGKDIVVYDGARANYRVTKSDVYHVVADTRTSDSDRVKNVERLHFGNREGLALDMESSAGNVARLVGAAFGKSYLNPEIVGIGIGLFDSGLSMNQVAQLIVDNQLLLNLLGENTNRSFVRHVYNSAVGQAPPESDLIHFAGILDRGELSRAGLLVLAANSDINAANIDLVGLQTAGLPFLYS